MWVGVNITPFPCVSVLELSFCGNTGKQKPLSIRGKPLLV